MKKAIITLAIIIWTLSLYAQSNNKPYEFPIKPGTEEWNRFTTVDEMFKACQVPEDVLSELTTEALLITCLNYPVNSILTLYNSPQQGFEDWKQQFNGILEFLKRKDAPVVLLTAYGKFDVRGYQTIKGDLARGAYINRLGELEIIMAQQEIIDNLSGSQRNQLLKMALLNFDILMTDEMYGSSSLASTGRIIGMVFKKQASPEAVRKSVSPEIEQYLATGLLKDPSQLESIVDQAKALKLED